MIDFALQLPLLKAPDALALIPSIELSTSQSPDFSAVLTEMIGPAPEAEPQTSEEPESTLKVGEKVSMDNVLANLPILFAPSLSFESLVSDAPSPGRRDLAASEVVQDVHWRDVHWQDVKKCEYSVRLEALPPVKTDSDDEAVYNLPLPDQQEHEAQAEVLTPRDAAPRTPVQAATMQAKDPAQIAPEPAPAQPKAAQAQIAVELAPVEQKPAQPQISSDPVQVEQKQASVQTAVKPAPVQPEASQPQVAAQLAPAEQNPAEPHITAHPATVQLRAMRVQTALAPRTSQPHFAFDTSAQLKAQQPQIADGAPAQSMAVTQGTSLLQPSFLHTLQHTAAAHLQAHALQRQVQEHPRAQARVTSDSIVNAQDTLPILRPASRVMSIEKPLLEFRLSERGRPAPAPPATESNPIVTAGTFAELVNQPGSEQAESVRAAHHVEIPLMPQLQVVRTVSMQVGEADSEVHVRIEERGGFVELKLDAVNEPLRNHLESSVESLVWGFEQEKVPVTRIEVGDKSLITKIRRMKEAQ